MAAGVVVVVKEEDFSVIHDLWNCLLEKTSGPFWEPQCKFLLVESIPYWPRYPSSLTGE
jgi:hypothetical protein